MTEFLHDSVLGFLPGTVGTVVLFVLGLILIIKGGDWFVDAATWVAEVTGIPKFLVGATIVSLATTLPELLVSSIATAQGDAEIAIGNAVGSVTANVGLIMGISIMVMPMVIKDGGVIKKGMIMLGATALLGLLCLRGTMSIWGALIVLAVLAYFTYLNISEAKTHIEADTEKTETAGTITFNVLKFIIGAAAIVAGAQLLVDTGTDLARLMGVSEKLIAITLVAIGTSLPELITTITALVKKEPGMSIGNIIGANIIDMTLILPVCTFVSGGKLIVPTKGALTLAGMSLPSLVWLDIPITLALMALAVLPPICGRKFRRWQGFAMIGVYVAYIAFVAMM